MVGERDESRHALVIFIVPRARGLPKMLKRTTAPSASARDLSV